MCWAVIVFVVCLCDYRMNKRKSLIVDLVAPVTRSISLNLPKFDLSKHVGVVGKNASGKRSVLSSISKACTQAGLNVETVNFDTHRATVKAEGNETVSRVLGGMRDNADIVVRFGLTSVWWRKVKSLSTGELRKVLLARAFAKNPDVLILDRPFDGLDAKSRKSLTAILDEISNTSQQSQARPLVQGIKWQERSPVRIVLATHRPTQELPSRIEMLLHCTGQGVVPLPRKDKVVHEIERESVRELPVSDDTEAVEETMAANEQDSPNVLGEPLLDIQRLTVFPVTLATEDVLNGKNSKRPLLDRVSWCIHPREVWWLQGENGASKSVLLSCALGPDKLLKLAQSQHANREWTVETDPEADRRRKRPPAVTCTDSVEMVSTELHIALLESDASLKTVRELLREKCANESRIEALLEDLDLDRSCLDRPFRNLSSGEQKLAMVCGAVAASPKLLILDEACQSLDLEHRRRVAMLVDKLCASATMKDCACVFVSHHEDELPRSVSHRLVLSNGKVLSRGHYHVPPQQHLR